LEESNDLRNGTLGKKWDIGLVEKGCSKVEGIEFGNFFLLWLSWFLLDLCSSITIYFYFDVENMDVKKIIPTCGSRTRNTGSIQKDLF